jgi:hypothetical protein
MNAGSEKVYPDCPVVTRAVEIGGLTKPQLIHKLREHSILMNESAERLFADDRFSTLDTKHMLETVELTVGDLGYARGATSGEFFARAGQLGLEPCPLELGPHLRLAYLDQPEGSFGSPVRQHKAPFGSITIASEPLDDDPATPKGFYIRRIDGVLWLRGYTSERTYVWNPGDHLVFCKSKPSLKT